jgi:hypothetical protein
MYLPLNVILQQAPQTILFVFTPENRIHASFTKRYQIATPETKMLRRQVILVRDRATEKTHIVGLSM